MNLPHGDLMFYFVRPSQVDAIEKDLGPIDFGKW